MSLRTPEIDEPVSEAPACDNLEVAPRAKNYPPLRAQIFQCLFVALVALGSYVFIRHYLLQSVEVVGVSMSPTLQNADRYLLNLCVYRVRSPQPSDIVVLRDPLDQSYAVKRIVACEGDDVSVKGGRLYVNGRQLNESYLPRGVRTFAPVRQEERSWRCGPGEYFVLGDNRDNSTDSRNYGAIPRQNILGAIIR